MQIIAVLDGVTYEIQTSLVGIVLAWWAVLVLCSSVRAWRGREGGRGA